MTRYVVWEWWERAQAWEPMTLPLTRVDAIDIAALSDADTCRILPAGSTPKSRVSVQDAAQEAAPSQAANRRAPELCPIHAAEQRDLEDAETLRQLGRDVPGLKGVLDAVSLCPRHGYYAACCPRCQEEASLI